MGPLYLVEASGKCSEYDAGYDAWIEDLSLGVMSDMVRYASAAHARGKELETELRERARGPGCKSIRTWHGIFRQVHS